MIIIAKKPGKNHYQILFEAFMTNVLRRVVQTSKKDRMEDIAQSLKANPLVLSKDVTMHSAITPEGHVAYVFRHQDLGE